MKTALLLGATGLTGSLLLQQLLQDAYYKKVIVYSRKSLNIQHQKLQEIIINFDTIDTAVEANDIFCCLGTTIKKAGSKTAFEKVDFEYPLNIAQLQKNAGSEKFLVITAMGASANSSIFYSMVKGKLEKELQFLHFSSLYIFRPSLIIGNRKEKRIGERIALILSTIINPLLIGSLAKYKSVTAVAIAKAMIFSAKENKQGNQIILSNEIKKFE